MGMRTIETPDGAEWLVVEVRPSLADDLRNKPQLSPELTDGWLAFQSGAERRRIIPIPEGWEELPEPELVALWEAAERLPNSRMRI